MFYAFTNVKSINSIILRNIKRLKQFENPLKQSQLDFEMSIFSSKKVKELEMILNFADLLIVVSTETC